MASGGIDAPDGHYDRLMYELRIEDQASFFNFLRMPPAMFD